MVQLTYNLDDISTVAVEPGKYTAKLIKCEQTLSSTKNPMLTWTWQIVSGAEKGKTIRSFTSLLPQALGNLKEHLEAFGFSGDVNLNTNKLIGNKVTLIVSVQEGESRNGAIREFSTVEAIMPTKTSRVVEEVEDDEDEYEDEYEDDEEDEDEYEDDEDEYEDDEDEYEEEEPEPAPPPRRRKKKVVATSKKTRKRSNIPF